MLRFSSIPALLALVLAGAASLAGGCGGDDDEEGAEPRRLELRVSQAGRELRFSAPRTAPAGIVEIRLTNSARKPVGAQLVRVDGERSPAEIARAGDTWADKGRPLPSWFHIVGGVASPTRPGETRTVTQELEPGNYLVFDIDSDANARFEVTGDTGDGELPSTEARIEADDYLFRASGLKAGRNRVEFDNVGKEPHFMLAAPLKTGRTIADVRRFAREERGEPPIVEEKSVSTAVLDGGRKQVVELQLQRGKYAMVCFVPDRRGGPPHAAKGMISEATVE